MKIGLLFFIVCLCILAQASVKIYPPRTNHSASFAIIVDSTTFAHVKDAVLAYRASVEKDGLGTYILSGQWSSPERIRMEILKLKRTDPTLEGIVLIGNIPIAMIRDAQHLTSAFKIYQNPERYPLERTSVPSDRFYDDLDLKFTFVQKDSANPLLFYYRLTPDSPQKIQSDLYSGRIKPPVDDESKYDRIKKYLLRIAKQKGSIQKLDNAFIFSGHGYHSESLDAWASELHALRELFPQLYLPGGKIKNYYHEMNPELKEIIIQELQNPEIDLAIFHAHGDDDVQYLLGIDPASTIGEHVEAIKKFVRSKQRQAKRRNKSLEELINHYKDDYDIPDAWFAGAFSDSLQQADSIWSAKQDLFASDVADISSQPRVIYLDECFNGAFFRSPYTAGEYVFNDGKTIAVVANSVNVLQDLWADEHIGLLGYGMRIGQRNRLNNYLESHVIGDPTFRFQSIETIDFSAAVTKKSIEKLLNSETAALRTLGVSMLAEWNTENLVKKLYKRYHTDSSYNVRLQALKQLVKLKPKNLSDILTEAASDPYELIRRLSVVWIGDLGEPRSLPVLINRMIHDVSTRVRFNAKRAIEKVGSMQAIPYFESAISSMRDSEYKTGLQKRTINSFNRSHEWLNNELIPKLRDKDLTLKKRISAARTFRNYRFHLAVPELIAIIRDAGQNISLRLTLTEALGWYHYSYRCNEIVQFMDELTGDDSVPRELQLTAQMTRNRLIAGPNNPITP